MIANPALSEDEVWGRELWELARNVADILHATGISDLTALEISDQIVAPATEEILLSRPEDYIVVAARPAGGATYNVTTTFLADKFRDDLTAAAHKRLRAFSNHTPSPVSSVAAAHP